MENVNSDQLQNQINNENQKQEQKQIQQKVNHIKYFKEGDPVIIYEEHNKKKLVFLEKDGSVNNFYGSFPHSQIIGQCSGTKIYSRKKNGFIIILEPTPVLYTQTLAHKTQILYTMDISVIIQKLNLIPGKRVVESGTGSASLSISIAKSIQNTGHLFTFEFNQERFENAKELFKKLKSQNTTVIWRDACGVGFLPQENEEKYDLQRNSIDAVFLDLPKPYEAITHAKDVLKQGGRICCFSPCIEQVQQNCIELQMQGFINIKTFESLSRNFERKERREFFDDIEDIPDYNDNNKKQQNNNDDEDDNEENNEQNEQGDEQFENINRKRKLNEVNEENQQKDTLLQQQNKIPQYVKKVYYTGGDQVNKGHTGYLTFAILP